MNAKRRGAPRFAHIGLQHGCPGRFATQQASCPFGEAGQLALAIEPTLRRGWLPREQNEQTAIGHEYGGLSATHTRELPSTLSGTGVLRCRSILERRVLQRIALKWIVKQPQGSPGFASLAARRRLKLGAGGTHDSKPIKATNCSEFSRGDRSELAEVTAAPAHYC